MAPLIGLSRRSSLARPLKSSSLAFGQMPFQAWLGTGLFLCMCSWAAQWTVRGREEREGGGGGGGGMWGKQSGRGQARRTQMGEDRSITKDCDSPGFDGAAPA